MLLPVASPPIGLGDVTADTDRFEVDERLITVVALVADDLFDAVPVGQHRLDLLGRFDQRLLARHGVSLIGVLHGHADDRARFEIKRVDP